MSSLGALCTSPQMEEVVKTKYRNEQTFCQCCQTPVECIASAWKRWTAPALLSCPERTKYKCVTFFTQNNSQLSESEEQISNMVGWFCEWMKPKFWWILWLLLLLFVSIYIWVESARNYMLNDNNNGSQQQIGWWGGNNEGSLPRHSFTHQSAPCCAYLCAEFIHKWRREISPQMCSRLKINA